MCELIMGKVCDFYIIAVNTEFKPGQGGGYISLAKFSYGAPSLCDYFRAIIF